MCASFFSPFTAEAIWQDPLEEKQSKCFCHGRGLNLTLHTWQSTLQWQSPLQTTGIVHQLFYVLMCYENL